MTIPKTAEDTILKELATSGQGAFLPYKSDYYIMVYYQSDDHKLCEKWRSFFGGDVNLTDFIQASAVSGKGLARGEYMWLLKGEEAYIFCKKILSWLRQYDDYRFGYCQQCIMKHLHNENHKYRQA